MSDIESFDSTLETQQPENTTYPTPQSSHTPQSENPNTVVEQQPETILEISDITFPLNYRQPPNLITNKS